MTIKRILFTTSLAMLAICPLASLWWLLRDRFAQGRVIHALEACGWELSTRHTPLSMLFGSSCSIADKGVLLGDGKGRDCVLPIFRLKSLGSLRVNCPNADDTWFCELGELRNLYELDLSHTNVTQNTLDCVATSHLSEVLLFDTSVNDDAMSHLKECSALSVLHIGRTGITDLGLFQLPTSRLRELGLSFTGISDRAGEFIATMPHLNYLDVRNTRITDGFYEHAAEWSSLRILRINGTNTSDNAIPRLALVRPLKMLDIDSKQFSTDGLATLRKLLPGCVIRLDNTKDIR